MQKFKNHLFNFNSILKNEKENSLGKLLADYESSFKLLKEGDLILILCKNSDECITLYVYCILNKIVPILLDYSLSKEFVLKIIDTYSPNHIYDPNRNIFEGYIISKNLNKGILSKKKQKIKHRINKDLSLLLSTSGSTGSPKLVRLTKNNLYYNAYYISNYLNIDSEEIAITNLPMSYSYGLSIINSHLMNGAKIILTNDSVIQRSFWDKFNECKVTSLSGVPYTYEILNKIKFLKQTYPSLKTMTQAGGRLSKDLTEKFYEYCNSNKISFFTMYGQTEGTARLSYLKTNLNESKIGSIGKSIEGGVFSLVDENKKVINEINKVGELVYEGPNVMLGYAEKIYDLNLGDKQNGKLYTGDCAYKDEHGFYYIVGRLKRFIKLFGNRFNLDQIEDFLEKNNVKSAVKGFDDNLEIYITEDKVDIVKDLIKSLKIHHSAYKVYKIDEIKKNSSGKKIYSDIK